VYKCFNRAVATASAGVLALGVHWVAGKTGQFEPYILTGSLFLLGTLRIRSSRELFVWSLLKPTGHHERAALTLLEPTENMQRRRPPSRGSSRR